MARLRVSRVARGAIAGILATSQSRWGPEGRRRYQALFTAAFRQLAASLDGPLIARRNDLPGGLRDFHLRQTIGSGPDRVRVPVHVIYYQVVRPDIVHIVTLLHERMDPNIHLPPTEPE